MFRSAVDAMWRERRLAAMRAEVEASHDAHPSHPHGHRGYDPNQPRVPKGHPDGGQWTSTGGMPGTDLTAVEPPNGFATSTRTTTVAMGGPTRAFPRPGPHTPIPPEVCEEWRRHAEQGIKGLLEEWGRLFKGRAGGSSKVPKDECDILYEEDSAICRRARSQTLLGASGPSTW